MNIYVGNLPYTVTSGDLEELFAEYGQVVSANVITDKHSGKSKGFGFVELDSEESGNKAIDELNGKEMDDREIIVNQARPRKEF